VIISPHTGFTVWNLTSFRDIIPAIGPVIYGMQQNPFMIRLGAQIGFV
jgi:hypothetical protein